MTRGLVLGILCWCSTQVYSQAYKTCTEIGFFGGGSYYIGDMNPGSHFRYSRPGAGLVYRYNLSKRHNIRATAFYGSVYGDDARDNDPTLQNRNLNFQSDIIEIAVGYEIDLFKYNINNMKHPITPYFFYQLAYMRMNPTTDYNGNNLELQPLGTEGQGTALNRKNNYSLNQITVPLGVGVKINLKDRLAISLEYGIRKTFTDYIDDVSGNYVDPDQLRAQNGPLAAELSDRRIDSSEGYNRGNANNKDWYSFYGFMITFNPFKRNICEMRGW